MGKDNISISEHWKDGAFAYLGVTTANFPNMFMLYGPNTNTGHTSIVYKQEAQVAMILQLMDMLESGNEAKSIEVDSNAEYQFNQEMQSRLSNMAWDKIESSWYKDGGRVTNNWPGSSLEYKRRTKTLIKEHFVIQ